MRVFHSILVLVILLLIPGLPDSAATFADEPAENKQTKEAEEKASGEDEDQETPAEQPSLTIGSPAPALDIEHWVQDGDGKLKPVQKFLKDKVYVVEFWATWCGPCLASMPHLSELQKKYAEQGVSIISISDEELEIVQEFLKQEAADQEGKTYDDITKYYRLTADPDGSSHKSYLEAAAQNGIPTAFIVGKDARIEWIGHPMAMDEPLDQIVHGKWDRAEFLAEFKAQQEMATVMRELMIALRNDETDKALKLIDDQMAKLKDGPAKDQLSQVKFRVVLRKGGPAATTLFRELLEKNKDNSSTLNELAWLVYQVAEAGEPVDKELVTEAIKAAQLGVEKSDSDELKGMTLDTLARLHHHQGDLGKAIELQKKAIELVTSQGAEEMKEFLEKLEAEKSGEKAESNDQENKADK